ncbi:MAG: hypothetical protein ABIU09_06010 [Pyrinomonadaceae bacterium]
MSVQNKLPGSVHSLVVGETLPKFDIKGAVVAITHAAKPSHH